MQVFHGTAVGDGIAIGRLQWIWKQPQQALPVAVLDTEAEVARYHEAVRQVVIGLQQLYEAACSKVGQAEAAVFEAHQMLVQDAAYQQAVEEIICREQVEASYAVAVTRDRFAALFAEMEDTYMQARAADVRDVSDRLLRVLAGEPFRKPCELAGTEQVIWAAEDLTPSEVIGADPAQVAAVVLANGSVYSHAAILAKAMGILVLTGCSGLPQTWTGDRIGIVETETGTLYVDPEPGLLARMQQRQRQYREACAEKQRQLQQWNGHAATAVNGKQCRVYANIQSQQDLPQVLANGAEGIGLFRSEYLYLERQQAPSEEEQFLVYRRVVEAMNGRPVIIRTLDIGGDKQCSYLALEPEANPALGCRGIRFCLARPELFRIQLRALFRASAYGSLSILYPMVACMEELVQIRQMAEAVKAELQTQRIGFGTVEQGIMIETPAAALISDLFAKEVDFFSIGTNDLTQYTLAMDRQNNRLASFYDVRHPAVLRMIRMTAENARKAGIRVEICGELAADLTLTKQFLDWGIHTWSVSLEQILPLRRHLALLGNEL